MRDGKKEWKKKLTLDWHWLIENSVCSRNESWLVWLISFHWLIDWLIESANYQLWIKQTNKQQITRKKQTNKADQRNKQPCFHSFIWLINWLICELILICEWVERVWFDWLLVDWLIDKRDTLKMDELERKSLIDSMMMREINERKNEFVSFDFDLIWLIVTLNWLRWMRKLWMLCDCPLASLIWFVFWRRWKLKQASEWQWEGLLVDLFVVTINWNSSSSSNLIDWMIEWMENWIDFNKQNKSSINSGGWLLKQKTIKQTNKQITHSQWWLVDLIDWLEIGKRSDIKMRLISFHFLLDWFLVDLWLIDWFWLIWWWFSNLTFSFFLFHSLTLNQRLIVWCEMKSTINCERLMEIESKQHQLVGSFIHLIDWLSTYSDLTLLIVTLIYLFFISFVSFFLIDWSNFDWLIWKLREMKERKRNELKCIWHWLNQIR